ncbi:MAG: STAS/SEC14 domain-containing protein [Bacteroidota bacterium]
MVEILDAPDGVVAVRIDGPAAESDANADAVRAALDRAADARGLFVEVGWILGDTREEFAALIRERFARLGARGDVERVAFVSGSYPRRSLLRDAAEPLDDVEVLVFPAAARSAALDWVAGAEDTVEPSPEADRHPEAGRLSDADRAPEAE